MLLSDGGSVGEKDLFKGLYFLFKELFCCAVN